MAATSSRAMSSSSSEAAADAGDFSPQRERGATRKDGGSVKAFGDGAAKATHTQGAPGLADGNRGRRVRCDTQISVSSRAQPSLKGDQIQAGFALHASNDAPGRFLDVPCSERIMRLTLKRQHGFPQV